MEQLLNNLNEWWDEQSTEDQAYITQLIAAIPAQFIGYKFYRKLGAPKWAAYGLSGLSMTASLAPARFAFEQRQRVRRASKGV
jgi:hypothetical protein